MTDAQIPILRDTKDPHYRYKMPKLTAKVEGSGNGIKTVLTNMTAVAKAIGRPPAYPTKYFGTELGAQTSMNNDIYVVNGSHDPDKLLKLLYDFIKKFVLCTKCNNPETSLTVVGQTIRQKCIACGHDTTIPKTHKLTTYIINHPADGTSTTTSSSKSGSKSSKSDKKGKKNGNSSPTNGTNGHQTNGGDNVENGVNNNNNNNNDDDDWGDDFDDEELTSAAYKERMRELCDGLNSDMYLSDQKENANIFYELLKEKKEKNLLADVNVQKELVSEAEKLKIKDKAVLILSELLFSENILDEIKTHRILLLRFCHENPKAQKYLLGGFEKLVGDVYKDKLFNLICQILKKFYDEDVLDEAVIIEWSIKESKKYVSKEMSKKIHEKAAPFIKWLKEAEEDSEGDDDDDEDDELEVKKPSSNNNNNNNNNNKKQAANPKSNAAYSKQQSNNQKQVSPPSSDQRRSSLEDEEDDDDGIDLEFSHRVSGITIESVKPTAPIVAVNADVAATAAAGDEDLDIDNI